MESELVVPTERESVRTCLPNLNIFCLLILFKTEKFNSFISTWHTCTYLYLKFNKIRITFLQKQYKEHID